MPTIFIPSSLRRYTASQSKVQVRSGSIDEVIEDLERQYPGVKSRLCNDSGQIKRHINVFVNDEEIRALQSSATRVSDKDEVSIVPAMAGGWR